jgi:hypothetical protein
MRKSRDEGLSWTDQRDGIVTVVWLVWKGGCAGQLPSLNQADHHLNPKPGIPPMIRNATEEMQVPTIQLAMVYIIPDPRI